MYENENVVIVITVEESAAVCAALILTDQMELMNKIREQVTS